MKRRILSILCVLCLVVAMLPPVTASAANLTNLTVGGTTVVEGSQTTENTSGQGWSYDVDSNILTLNNATINGTDTTGYVGAGIYAEGDLTIVLEGTNTVTGADAGNNGSNSIRVDSGNLTIQGGGSLTAQGAETSSGSSYGIFVIGSFTQQSGSVTAIGGDVSGSYNSTGLYVSDGTVTAQDGTLTATGGDTSGRSYGISMFSPSSVTVGSAAVTATGGNGQYSYGLYVSPSSPSVSPSVTLSGSGSLTARSGSATKTAGGIYLDNIRGSTGSVTVGDNSTLLASSVILYDNSFEAKPLAPTGNGSWLIYGQSNQTSAVGGNYTLKENITIPEDVTLTIPAGGTLTVPTGITLTVNGTLNIANQSSLTGSGTLNGSGNFYLTNPEPVISGSETLTYDGTDQFGAFKLEAPTGTVEVMGKEFAISSSPSTDGWEIVEQEIKNAGTYTLTAKNSDGSRTVTKEITVSKATSSSIVFNYPLSYTYTGQPLANPTAEELTLTGAGYIDVTFTWYAGTSPNGTQLDSAPTDAGTYYLVASILESNNTSGSSTTSGAITISPATISITSATVQDKTYDGNQDATVESVTFEDLANGESLSFGTDYTATAVFNSANAGSQSATVTVTLKGGSNYTFAGNQDEATYDSATGTISPLPVVLEWETTSFAYDGNLKTVTATVTNRVGEDVITLSYEGNTGTAVNSYTATVTGLDNTNYTLDNATGTTQAWSITKATPTGTPKYTAITTSGKTLADAGLTTKGSTFSVPGTVAWEQADTTQVQANTAYTWKFTPTDSDNYNSISGSITLYVVSSSGGGGSSGGGSSNITTETTKNPDGSTTTTVTNNTTGTVTETTKNPDGSKEVVETKKDGTVTTTTTDTAGNKTQVVENTDGTKETTITNKDGSSSATTVDETGKTQAEVKLPAAVVEDAQGEAVTLPMPEVPITTDRETAPTVTVDLPSGTSAKVEIPVAEVTPGTVAVIVKADGTEEVIKTSLTTENGVAVTLSDGDTVKVVDNSKTFDDVADNYWGAEAVDFTSSRELFAGTSATTFAPDTAMTRAMIVTVLARFEGVDTTTGSTWYEAGQQWAMQNGVSDGSNMDASLTREQLVTMFYRYAQSKGYDTTQGGMAIREYADFEQISDYAVEAMTWAVNTGIINGTSSTTLSPQGEATRAQVATILMRFIEMI